MAWYTKYTKKLGYRWNAFFTTGYMAAGLGKTEVIALGSILGVFAFLVSLGVAAYCYR